MNSLWHTLGLEGPTTDLRAIKRAYSLRLKVTRPDDDPEGFMALRDAFERAKDYARYAERDVPATFIQGGVPDAPSGIDETVTSRSLFADAEPKVISSEPEAVIEPKMTKALPPYEAACEALENVTALLKNGWQRTSRASWRKIFDDPAIASLDASSHFEHLLRDYFMDVFGHFDQDSKRYNSSQVLPIISPEIGAYIFQCMGWDRAERRDERAIALLGADLGVSGDMSVLHANLGGEDSNIDSPAQDTKLAKSSIYWVLVLILLGAAHATLKAFTG